MNGDNTNNPYAPPEPVEETPVVKKSKPVTLFRLMHTVLIVLAAPAFLYCATSPLLLEVREGWQHARAFAFVVAYFGLFFRKEWAYWTVALVAGTRVAQVIYLTNSPNENMTHSTLKYGTPFVTYFALIVISAVVCAVTSRRQLKQ